jgi:hydroxypyruvate isomerase
MEGVHGKSLSLYKQYADIVGHIQIADVPGRHQPGTGIMDFFKPSFNI